MQHDPTTDNPNGCCDQAGSTPEKDDKEKIIELQYNLWSAEAEINYLRGLCRQQLGMLISTENAQRLYNHGMAKLQRDQTEPLERKIGEQHLIIRKMRELLSSIFQNYAYLKDKYPYYSDHFTHDPDQYTQPAPSPDQWARGDRDQPPGA